ncbi:MAG: oligoribonuclease [bacterium]|nr:oligoribonuclease [bacterium]
MEEDTNLVWIDLEMTGLDPNTDVILEIASIVTDSHLTVLEEGPHVVIHQPDEKLNKMNEWVREQHTRSGLLEQVRESTITIAQAEEKTLSFLRGHCKPEIAPLCGNSVWQDRAFMSKYTPRIVNFLYYRIIDVTSVKEIALRWYPDDVHATFKKKDTHRALEDIRESIAELRHYRKYFFV